MKPKSLLRKPIWQFYFTYIYIYIYIYMYIILGIVILRKSCEARTQGSACLCMACTEHGGHAALHADYIHYNHTLRALSASVQVNDHQMGQSHA